MTHRFILGSLSLTLAAVFATGPEAARAGTSAIDRPIDPIIVVGDRLGPLSELPIVHLRLLAAGKRGLQPIPFQIDEKDKDGKYVFQEGKKKGKDDGLLDDNDEIVFMAADLGHRVLRSSWPTSVRTGVEIEARDPLSRGRGYAYLFYYDDPPALSGIDYVTYDAENDRVKTDTYEFGFPARFPMTPDYLAVKSLDGNNNGDLLDRFKMRTRIRFFFGLFKISKTEENFKSRIEGYTDGRVRIIRRLRSTMYLVWRIPSPAIISHSFYYRDFFTIPTVVEMPFDPAVVVTDIHLTASTDFTQTAKGLKFYTSSNPKGVRVDGVMSNEEMALDFGEFDWLAVAGRKGGMINLIVFGPTVHLEKTLHYVDSAEEVDPPEEDAGQYANSGFVFNDLSGLGKGRHVFNIYGFLVDSYWPGKEKTLFRVVQHPLDMHFFDEKRAEIVSSADGEETG